MILGDTRQGSMTITPTATGVTFVFRNAPGKDFATFDLDNKLCAEVGKRLIDFSNRQRLSPLIIPGG